MNANAGESSAVLIVTALDDMESIASALAAALRLTLDVASTRTTALRLLGRRSYAAVVLDQLVADADPEGADLVWKHAGLAVPLQMSFALAGAARLEREIRAALGRRVREQQLAAVAAAAQVDAALRNAVTGFLLESQLALAEDGIPPCVQSRLEHLATMAEQLRDRLGAPS